jgi:hypothetical protein
LPPQSSPEVGDRGIRREQLPPQTLEQRQLPPAKPASSSTQQQLPQAFQTPPPPPQPQSSSAAGDADIRREQQEDVDMEDRTDRVIAIHTREVVRKKRAVDIKNRMGAEMMTYESIRGANIRKTTAANLLGGHTKMAPAMAGMVDSGDGRILSDGLKMALNTKQIVTTSFDSSWYCYSCAFHNIRPALRTRG